MQQSKYEWDVFISHASEDKDSFVKSLADELAKRGVRVWYDDFTLKIGDSLRHSIAKGLSESRFGIVVLSLNFFKKHWTQQELSALFVREEQDKKVILPIWLDLSKEEVSELFPLLADKKAVHASSGLKNIVSELLDVIDPEQPIITDSISKNLYHRILSLQVKKQIKEELIRVLSHEDYPLLMSLSGEIVANPIWDKVAEETKTKLVTEYHPSSDTSPRIMMLDIFLIRANDNKQHPRLLTYFSNKPKSGWQAYLFPFRHRPITEDIKHRHSISAEDVGLFLGVSKSSVTVSSLGSQYAISVKPDPGYSEMVTYVFQFCSVQLLSPPAWLSTVKCDYVLDKNTRRFRWFHPEDFEHEARIMQVNSDLVRAIHYLFSTTIPTVPISVPDDFLTT